MFFEAGLLRGADEDEWSVTLGVEHGLTERVQVALEVPYIFVEPDDPEEGAAANGFDLATLSLQFGLLPPRSPFAVALALEAGLPVAGRNGPGDDQVTTAVAVLLAWVVDDFELFGGVKSTWCADPTEPWSSSSARSSRSSARPSSCRPPGRLETDDDVWELGPEFIIEDLGPFDLGLGLQRAFQDGPDDWSATVTLTWSFD